MTAARPSSADRGRSARSRRTRRLVTVVVLVLVLLAPAGLRFLPGAPLHPGSDATDIGDPTVQGTLADQVDPDLRAVEDRTGTPAGRASRAGREIPAYGGLLPTDVRLDVAGWWSWALLDTATGEISGSTNLAETNQTASLIKPWIAADYLRTAAERGELPDGYRMHQLEIMIRDSDNDAAQAVYREIGQWEAVLRMIDICGLTDSSPADDGGWSKTRLSPRDAVRLGVCLADGRAAGPDWTDWLLDEMRAVRGVGDFGIRAAFPAEERSGIAIKNGWVERTETGRYEVNCLAIGDGWAMSVMTAYPAELGYGYGAQTCQEVAAQLRGV
jgi:hypothetical protein